MASGYPEAVPTGGHLQGEGLPPTTESNTNANGDGHDESRHLLTTTSSGHAGDAGEKSPQAGRPGSGLEAEGDHDSSIGEGHRSCLTTCLREAPVGPLLATLLIGFGSACAGIGVYFGVVEMRRLFSLHPNWMFTSEWVGIGLAGGLLAYALIQYLFITLSNSSTYDRLFRRPEHPHLCFPYAFNYFILYVDGFAFLIWLVLLGLFAIISSFNVMPHVLFKVYNYTSLDLRHYGIFPDQLANETQMVMSDPLKFEGSRFTKLLGDSHFLLLWTFLALVGALLNILGIYLLTIFVSIRVPRLDPEVNALDESEYPQTPIATTDPGYAAPNAGSGSVTGSGVNAIGGTPAPDAQYNSKDQYAGMQGSAQFQPQYQTQYSTGSNMGMNPGSTRAYAGQYDQGMAPTGYMMNDQGMQMATLGSQQTNTLNSLGGAPTLGADMGARVRVSGGNWAPQAPGDLPVAGARTSGSLDV